MRVANTIYGRRNAGYLSEVRLDDHFASRGYAEEHTVRCLYSHPNGTKFVRVTCDFAVLCISAADNQHFVDTIATGG
jgi:hypothetical protein